MAKVFVQDVVPAGKRSIRNIPLPESRVDAVKPRPANPVAEVRQPVRNKPPVEPPVPPQKRSAKSEGSGRGKSRLAFWAMAVIVLLVVAYIGSFMFVSATVKVTPREMNLPLDVAGTASLKPIAGELGYTIVTLSREGSKEVPAGTEEKVERKASGKVVVYNNYSTAPQTLVANTRFETKEGLIFRIQNQVSIPGQKNATTPGSAVVTIYADQPGEKYNVGLTDFTIPGFKGDPRYTKFSAKSDPTAPIAGGFVGTTRKVTQADTVAAKASIETQLKNELRDMIAGQIPNTHILFKNAATFSFKELPQEKGAAATTAMIREQGSIYGILFDKQELSKFLASRIAEINGKDVSVSNMEELNFVLDNMSAFNPESTEKITFRLTGSGKFVWNVNGQEITQNLAGQKRANIKDILSKFESIDRANVSLSPVWVFTLPKDPQKIKVESESAQ